MRWPTRFPIILMAACSLPASAAAQTAVAHLQLDRYQPTPFSDRILRLDGTRVPAAGELHLGLDADYAFRPLVLTDTTPGSPGTEHHLVEHALSATVLASLSLASRLEAGLAVPLTIVQAGDNVAGAANPSVAGIGNVRLGLKAQLLDHRGLGLGATLVGAAPAGAGTLAHESGWTGEGRLLAGYRRGSWTAGVGAGLLLRSHKTFYDVPLGNQFTATAGVTWQLWSRTALLAELAGSTAAGSPFATAKQSPVEGLLGLRQRLKSTWFTLAAGPGLVNGYGSPVFRVVAGATWANRPPDRDLDGISDDDDRCPDEPEDRDGFQDTDGCPDPDNDKDLIPDTVDKCPNQPEDRDGFQDTDGCPDPDNDKDLIPDTVDRCPNEPETVNDFQDEDGCPDASPPASDKDRDGIPDDTDECPEEPEDRDGFEDADGCPDLDNDKDGIPDAVDKCPLEPETINGIEDEDGCPDKGQSQVRLGQSEIETLQPIYFDTDRSRVRHAFYNTLGQIASLLKAHPEIGRCAIEGHTDDTGPPEWNQKLSVLRAAAVIEFLADKGVEPKRLVPIGHGEHLPWASNETPEGRAMNRRVVFHIEGVNPEEQQKQEQRLERRRRIRHHRDAEQKEKPGRLPPPELPMPPKTLPPSRPQPASPGAQAGSTEGKSPPAAPPPRPVDEKEPADDEPDAPAAAKKVAPATARPAARPARRSSPDAGSGMPPTLRELLKLPPR